VAARGTAAIFAKAGCNHLAPDWFTTPAHSVPREPGWPSTDVSGVCADADKWRQNDLFRIHSTATVPRVQATKQMIRDGMVRVTHQVFEDCQQTNLWPLAIGPRQHPGRG
jgi:hypothetical protein